MRIVLLGDLMLGRLVNRYLASTPPEYPWGNTLPLLRSGDALIINLECVLADRGKRWPGKVFTFRSDSKNVAVLTAARVTAVSLANNHSLDYGPDALLDCIAVLNRHAIRLAGAGASGEMAAQPTRFWIGDRPVTFVAFTDNELEWEAGERPGVHYIPLDPPDERFDRLLATIDAARRPNDLVIVSAHWGPNWGYHPLREHVQAAHLLVDAGADVVFGHSPHIVRGIELYHGRPILYSCGDYIDDYAIDEIERNDESFVFCLDYEGNELQRILLVPTLIERFQATLARGVDHVRIVKMMQVLCDLLNTESRVIAEGLEIAPRSSAS
jgi:poly-gamma-glutamate synthesis protein (capsule biosynthesis protein)